MADHHAQPGRGGGLEHPARAQEAALLHHLELHQVGRIGADDRQQARMVEHRLVGHYRYATAFAAHAGQAGEIGGGCRLLEQLQLRISDHVREADRFVRRVAGVGIDAQLHAVADGRAHREHPVAVGLDAAADLDLGRAEAAVMPALRLGSRLVRRQDADPCVERHPVAHRAAEPGVHRQPAGARDQVGAGHLDRGLRIEEGRLHRVHPVEQHMHVGGIHAAHRRRQHVADHRQRILDRLFRVTRRRIDVAKTDRAAGRGHPDDHALLDLLGGVGVLEALAHERHRDTEGLDAFDAEIAGAACGAGSLRSVDVHRIVLLGHGAGCPDRSLRSFRPQPGALRP